LADGNASTPKHHRNIMTKALRLIVAFEQRARANGRGDTAPIHRSHVFAAYAEGRSADLANPETEKLALDRLAGPLRGAMRDSFARINGELAPMWPDRQIQRFGPIVYAKPAAKDIAPPEPFVFALMPQNSQAIMQIADAKAWGKWFRENLSHALGTPVVSFQEATSTAANGPLFDADTVDTVMRTLSGEDHWRIATWGELCATLDAAFGSPALRAVRESELLSEIVKSSRAADHFAPTSGASLRRL